MIKIYGLLWKITIIFINYTHVVNCGDSDYNVIHKDGSYEFGGDSPDSYHYAVANRKNIVRGEFGGRNPKTGAIDSTIYTAGPRGFRPRGKNIVRNYDLSQSGPRPIGSRDDPYYDPYEDPSYQFGFRTRTQSRQESANRVGDVTGKYSYIDDVGEKHDVEYIAGKRTGFHVKTPFPDSNTRAYGPLYFRGRGRPIPRGRTSIQRGLDGSYKFVSAGPDQRRTEISDATGHVRGSYTYLDDKGVQHSVHYIAGPETGYRVLKNVKGPHLPTVFPFGRPDIISPDFYDYYDKDVADVGDVFGNTGSGSTPRPGGGKSDDEIGELPKPGLGGQSDYNDDYDVFGGNKDSGGFSSTTSSPGSGSGSTTTNRPDDYSPSTPSSGDGYYSSPKPEYGPPHHNKPSTSSGSDEDDNFGLFDGDSGDNLKPPGRPESGGSSGGGHHHLQVGTDKNCPKCKGTIVTNVGDTLFSVPPGVSVRAHIQAIDLTPFESRYPSPSEQLRMEMRMLRKRQLERRIKVKNAEKKEEEIRKEEEKSEESEDVDS